MYLGRRSIENADQVCRAILQDRPIPVTPSGEIPLGVLSPTRVVLSQQALEYPEFFRLAPSVIDVLKTLQPIFRNFSLHAHSRFNHYFNIDLYRPTDRRNIDDCTIAFVAKLILSTASTPIESPSLGDGRALFEGLDHRQLVYRLVATSLGLDPSDCRSHGLKLMVVVNRTIGLMAPDILDGGRDVITISTSSLHDEHRPKDDGELMLEAVKIADEPFLRYRAAGIWVPHGRREVFKAGAYIEPKYPNALLG
jgi:hypothetical protein